MKDQPTLKDCQAFHRHLDELKGFSQDLPLNVMLLVEEVGEVAKEVRRLTKAHQSGQASDVEKATSHLREELADCLAYVVKLANYTGIDLEEAYVEKMRYNIHREWHE
ncbi:MAG: hypothetical protein OWT28_10800 [Firmicutes bacterium]|nr:hypothetical protein [Bacillota bacterium]